MSSADPNPQSETRAEITDTEIDEALAEFGGNARETIRALLHDIAVLADRADRAVSRGFVRGLLPSGRT